MNEKLKIILENQTLMMDVLARIGCDYPHLVDNLKEAIVKTKNELDKPVPPENYQVQQHTEW